jgi:hypothetical protein
MPAGTNGNPAFEIAGDLGGGRFGRCQATLIEDGTGDPSTCSVASAGHCVLSEQGLRIRRFGTFYGDVIASQVDVIPNGNPGESYARDDTAMIHFSGEVCKTMKSKAPALRLRTTPIQEGETVYAGTRYFGKLHLGQVDSSDKGQTTVNFNFADESGKHQGGVHSGDSGGPLLTVNKDGKFELAGVLSASNDDSQYHQDALGRPTVGGQVGYYASRPEIASYWLRTRPGSQNTELALGYASHEVPTTY